MRDGVAITQFRGDKVRALLVYLAIEFDRPHSRAHLAGLLWPEQGDDAALANLSNVARTAAHGAERRSGAGRCCWARARRSNGMAHSGAEVDVTAFVRLARSTDPAALEQAVALYRGPLLPGFSIPGCPAFDEWLLLTREHCERLALAALDTTGHDLYRDRRAYGRPKARRAASLALDPWRETAHRQLHARAGRHGRPRRGAGGLRALPAGAAR